MLKPSRLAGALALACALACAAPTFAQVTPPPPIVGPSGAQVAPPDTNNAPYYGEVALTPGTPDTVARRSLKAVCTAAGTIAVTYYDGSTGTWAAVVGTQTFPIAVTLVNTAGTTATCAYTNLK